MACNICNNSKLAFFHEAAIFALSSVPKCLLSKCSWVISIEMACPMSTYGRLKVAHLLLNHPMTNVNEGQVFTNKNLRRTVLNYVCGILLGNFCKLHNAHCWTRRSTTSHQLSFGAAKCCWASLRFSLRPTWGLVYYTGQYGVLHKGSWLPAESSFASEDTFVPLYKKRADMHFLISGGHRGPWFKMRPNLAYIG